MEKYFINIKENINLFNETNKKDYLTYLMIYNFFYYIGLPLIDDDLYDQYTQYFQQKFSINLPNNIDQLQFKENEKEELLNLYKKHINKNFQKDQYRINTFELKLPIQMPSLDKIYPQKSQQQLKLYNDFMQQQEEDFNYQLKLDGVSVLYHYNQGQINLYTRGNGIYGRDITQFAKYIRIQEKKFQTQNIQFYLRGEIVISKQKYQEKYINKFKHPRNISAQVNKQYINNIEDIQTLQDLQIVYYSVYCENKYVSQLKKEKTLENFEFVQNKYLSHQKNSNDFDQLIHFQYHDSLYPSDGIVICKNYPQYINNLEEEQKIAIKFNDMKYTAIVQNVTWNISKNGLIKPVIQIDDVNIDGVIIKNVSGHNYKYIIQNCIGPGTILKIIRSGQVIPYITDIVQNTPKEKLQYPQYQYYQKNADDVDVYVVLTDETMQIILSKQLEYFFQVFKQQKTQNIKHIKQIKQKTLIKIIQQFKLKSIFNFLQLNINDINIYNQLLQIPGFKEKKIKQVKDALNNINNEINEATKETTIKFCISLSLIPNLGEKIFNLIINQYSSIKQFIFQVDLEQKLQNILQLGEQRIQQLLLLQQKFRELYDTENYFRNVIEKENKEKENKEKENKEKKENNYKPYIKNLIFTLSETRDSTIINTIKQNGGFYQENYTKKTDVLLFIYKENMNISQKINKAIKDNKKIYCLIKDQQQKDSVNYLLNNYQNIQIFKYEQF